MSPAQYPIGDPCDTCGKPLSRYNPSVTCSPCQARLWAARARAIIDAGEEDSVAVGLMPWEGEPQRKAVRRGPLMLDTASMYEQDQPYRVERP
jgi:hypothetical protein